MHLHRALEKLGKTPELVRSETQIHHTVGAKDLLAYLLALSHAAAKHHDALGVLALDVGERADISEHPHLGVLAHGAGVHDDDVRELLVAGHGVTHGAEKTAKDLAVGLVLLTSVGVHHGETFAGPEPEADPFAEFKLFRCLFGGDLPTLKGHVRVSFGRVFWL